MTATCAPRLRFDQGLGVSRESRQYVAALLAGITSVPAKPTTPEEQVVQTLADADRVIQEYAQPIGAASAAAVRARLRQIVSIDAQEDGDVPLDIGSLRTLLSSVVTLGNGPGDITLNRSGNLVSAWMVNDSELRVEALATGRVTWTLLHPRGSEPRYVHADADTIGNVRLALEG